MATKVVDLVYWRDIGKTGMVFTGVVVGLASIFQISAITILSYLCLGIMCFTFPLRLYYKLLEILSWNPGVHPFQYYLDNDNSLTDETTVLLVEEAVLLIAFALTEIKRLLFIESMVDSIKFVVLMYLLTYVGILANGLTLVIIGVICLFSFPVLYRKQQGRIKRLVKMVKAFLRRIRNTFKKMYSKLRPSPATAVHTAVPETPAPTPKQKAKAK